MTSDKICIICYLLLGKCPFTRRAKAPVSFEQIEKFQCLSQSQSTLQGLSHGTIFSVSCKKLSNHVNSQNKTNSQNLLMYISLFVFGIYHSFSIYV